MNTFRDLMPPSGLLPRDAVEALVAASKVESHIGPGESKARSIAVAEATKRVKREHFQFFQADKE